MRHALPVCGTTLFLPTSRKFHSALKLRHFLAGPLTQSLPELLFPAPAPLEEAGVRKRDQQGMHFKVHRLVPYQNEAQPPGVFASREGQDLVSF